jgi:gas vesicle protein
MAQVSVKHAAGFLVAGAMVGAAVALLYAPQSGARTKRDLKKFVRNTRDRLDDLQADIRNQGTDWVENVTDVVQNGIDSGKKLSSQGYEKVLKSFDGAIQCVDDAKSRVERLIKSS